MEKEKTKCERCNGIGFIYSSNFTGEDVAPNEIECPDCNLTPQGLRKEKV